MPTEKGSRRKKRHLRVRGKISGTSDRPRLCVFRSSKSIYAQIIDDSEGNTLVACSTKSREVAEQLNQHGEGAGTVAAARRVGLCLAQRALSKGIQTVRFDRGGFLYHGRVKALAEGVREGGLAL